VIVVDPNLLLYAYSAASPHHQRALSWSQEILSGEEAVGLPWQTIAAFVRIATDHRVPGYRRSPEEVMQTVEQWLERPQVRILWPGDRFIALFRGMVIEAKASGPLISDAEIAALTIEHGGVLYTADRDFARFPGLRWKNPLSSPGAKSRLHVATHQHGTAK
jgi:toxin-antitoxin system PIN domain toxin